MKLGHLLAGLVILSPTIQAANRPEAFPGLPERSYLRIDPGSIEVPDTGRVRVQAGQRTLAFQMARSRVHANGDRSFSAYTQDGDGWMHATTGPHAVFGEIHRDGKHWRLTTDRHGAWLVELPDQGISYNSCGVDHRFVRSGSFFPDQKNEPDPNSSVKSKDQPGTVIDLLVIYNQAMADRYPGDLLDTRINHLVDIANVSMANSGIDLGFRLVGLEFFDYRNDSPNADLLVDMASALSGANPPGLEGLGARRNTLGADLVIMLRPHAIEIRGNCGIAYYPNDNDPAFGVNVVSDGMSSWSACLDDVLTHEIGHNLGAAHQAGAGGGTFDARGAAFARPGQFNTMMASFGTGRPDRFRGLPVFSSPAITCGGYPCGNAVDTDNATVMREVIPAVAAYRADRSALPLPEALPRSDADTDGDGVSDWLDHFPFEAAERDDADLDGAGDNTDAFPDDAGEQVDTDADGVGDNADVDDDGDGVDDPDDAFPLDATESADPDRDGVGSNADAFPGDPDEFRDTDEDGVGDNEDPDDDGDGIAELDSLAEDILVVSTGNSRILRFDAATGMPRGIEVAPVDGLLTFQSDLTWRRDDNILLYLSDSSIKRLGLLDRRRLGTWVPAYDDANPGAPQLSTGFPTSLQALGQGSHVAVSLMDDRLISVFFGHEQPRRDTIFNWAVNPEDDGDESPTDLVSQGNVTIVLGQTTRSLYRIDALGSYVLSGPDAKWMRDPRRMAFSAGGRLFIADRGRNAVLEVDPSSGDFLGEFADLAALGYRRPTSVAVTAADELLVASEAKHAILAFDIGTGAFLGERVTSRAWGLNQPHAMIVVPALLDRRGDDPARVIRPNPGLWFNPATNGRGFDIQVFGKRLTAIWYTYSPFGYPVWYFSSGVLDGFTYRGTLLRMSLDDQGQSSFEEVGELEITFGSERQAEMRFTLGETQGGEPIQWLAFDHDPAASDYTALWGREDGPGWGVSLATQGDTHVAIAFIYDVDGQPSWAISEPVSGSAPLDFNMNMVLSDTLCPSCSGAPQFETEPVGTMILQPGEDGYWTSDIQTSGPYVPEVFNGVDWVLDEVPIVRFSDPPEPPR